jgi:hypothetical protein
MTLIIIIVVGTVHGSSRYFDVAATSQGLHTSGLTVMVHPARYD